MEKLKDYYRTLGIEPGASLEEIKQAYRDSVHVWHPDRFQNNPRLKEKAEEKMREVNDAYEKLTTFFRDYGTPNLSSINNEPTSTCTEPAQNMPPGPEPRQPSQNKRTSKPFTLTNESLPYLLLVFNTIVISVLIFAKSSILYQGDISLLSWLGESTVLFGFAAIITGLAWLIFRKREAGKTRKSFIISSWVIFCLVTFGQCQSTKSQNRLTAAQQSQPTPVATMNIPPPPAQLPMSSVPPPSSLSPSRWVSGETTQEVVSQAYLVYPFLNNESPNRQEKAILEVRARRFELEGQGLPTPQALAQAVNEIGPRYSSSTP